MPFTAVRIFQDPSVPFAVQFEIAAKPGQAAAEPPRAIEDLDAEPFAQDAGETEAGQPDAKPVPVAAAGETRRRGSEKETTAKDDAAAANEAQVVSLDAFRKKS